MARIPPRDLATRMRQGAIQETFVLHRAEVRIRAKRIFEEFPAAMYLTEIVSSRRLRSGKIELTVRRRSVPIETE